MAQIDWGLVFSGIQSVASLVVVIGAPFYLWQHKKKVRFERCYDHSGRIFELLNESEKIFEEVFEYQPSKKEAVNFNNKLPEETAHEIDISFYRCEVMKFLWERYRKPLKEIWVQIKIQIMHIGDKKLAEQWEKGNEAYQEVFLRYFGMSERLESKSGLDETDEKEYEIIRSIYYEFMEWDIRNMTDLDRNSEYGEITKSITKRLESKYLHH